VFTRLAVGDAVQVEGPLGSSYLRVRHTGPILLAAGGSGMAPMLSILESALHLGLKQPIRLYFGVRDARDVYGGERLAALAARHPNFHADVVLSAAGTAAPGYRTGMLHEVIAADWPELEIDKAYLAGPPVMVEAVSDLLRERGVAPRDIHADAYYTAADKAKLQPAHGVAVAGD
jgi:CDP-4-dehydro-6-deoxyglucose reductase/ferredoxin-NAD(P)+ reductase (naphthalene dioxygenase ferredoxin-specific)